MALTLIIHSHERWRGETGEKEVNEQTQNELTQSAPGQGKGFDQQLLEPGSSLHLHLHSPHCQSQKPQDRFGASQLNQGRFQRSQESPQTTTVVITKT